MNFEEPLDKKIRSCNGNAKSLNKLFTKLARAAEDFSDILDEFDPDAVVATIETEVFSNVPSTIPSSVLSPICAFLAKWFDENIADHMVREDWVHSAMSAVERCIGLSPNDARAALKATEKISDGGSTYLNIVSSNEVVNRFLQTQLASGPKGSAGGMSKAAIDSIANKFQGNVPEAKAREYLQTMCRYMDELGDADTAPSTALCSSGEASDATQPQPIVAASSSLGAGAGAAAAVPVESTVAMTVALEDVVLQVADPSKAIKGNPVKPVYVPDRGGGSVFWGASNAIADGASEGLRQVILETGLARHAVFYVLHSKPQSLQSREAALLLANLACPVEGAQPGDVDLFQRQVCSQLRALGAVEALLHFYLSETKDGFGYSDGWERAPLQGLVGLLLWANDSPEVTRTLAQNEAFIKELQSLCLAETERMQRSMHLLEGRVASILLVKHFPEHATEAATAVYASLSQEPTRGRGFMLRDPVSSWLLL